MQPIAVQIVKRLGRLRFEAWRQFTQLKLRLRGTSCKISASSSPRGNLPIVRSRQPGNLTLKIGTGVSFGPDVVIEHGGGHTSIRIGPDTRIEDRVFLRVAEDPRPAWDHRTDSGVIEIGARCEIRSGAIFRSTNRLSIGNDVMISHFCMLHCGSGTRIGSRSVLAERVTTADSDHAFDPVHTYHAPAVPGPILIGPNVLISH